ncbi:MAG: AraC family transcriptional regulator [Verrucomicrobiota bacterium]
MDLNQIQASAGEVDRPWQDGVGRIEQSIDYMRRHLNEPLPVAKLAAVANVSPSHFFALFKRRTGCTPIDYFIRLRMEHASRLLERTGLNVKEVASALGYDDPFYFSRTFKSVHRVAPSDFRRQRQACAAPSISSCSPESNSKTEPLHT